MTSLLYELKELKKDFDHRTVLNLKSLSLEKSKIISLLGPNGAGKTTLLEIMAFLSSPTSGEVWFNGEKIDFSKARLMYLRRKVVVVQQHPILFTTKVSRNVEFPLKIRGISKRKREGVVEELLDNVGMGAFTNAKAHKLSAGETQRVAIARALACSPEVVLLDEPTANVDVENQITIERIIREINKAKGISVIFATHNMMQASRLSDKTIFLHEGQVARSTYENIFSGHIETDVGGRRHCLLQNGLKLAVRSEKSGTVRLSIDPSAIRISPSPGFASDENTFQGKLMQLTDERNWVRALIDIGIPVSALIPKNVFKSLAPTMGDTVWVTCPIASIEVF